MILMHVMTCQNCKGIGGSQPISDRHLNSLFSELHLLDTLYIYRFLDFGSPGLGTEQKGPSA